MATTRYLKSTFISPFDFGPYAVAERLMARGTVILDNIFAPVRSLIQSTFKQRGFACGTNSGEAQPQFHLRYSIIVFVAVISVIVLAIILPVHDHSDSAQQSTRTFPTQEKSNTQDGAARNLPRKERQAKVSLSLPESNTGKPAISLVAAVPGKPTMKLLVYYPQFHSYSAASGRLKAGNPRCGLNARRSRSSQTIGRVAEQLQFISGVAQKIQYSKSEQEQISQPSTGNDSARLVPEAQKNPFIGHLMNQAKQAWSENYPVQRAVSTNSTEPSIESLHRFSNFKQAMNLLLADQSEDGSDSAE